MFSKKHIKKVTDELKKTISNLKHELDDHRESINENTGELQEKTDGLYEIDQKMNKLQQRIDDIQVSVEKISQNIKSEKTAIQPLNLQEKQVFLVLYLSGEKLTFKQISEKLHLSTKLVKQHINVLITKGISVVIEYKLSTAYLSLDKAFKELQARENIIEIKSPLFQPEIGSKNQFLRDYF